MNAPTALTAVTALVAACAVVPARAHDAEQGFLSAEVLRGVFAGATLIGGNWAEYYDPGGSIVGKVRYLGVVRAFNGRWSVSGDAVCFEYDLRQYDTCSKFRLEGDRMRHFAADGQPKADGESRLLKGNRLDRFR